MADIGRVFAEYWLTGILPFVVRYLRRQSLSIRSALVSLSSMLLVMAVAGLMLLDYNLMQSSMKHAMIAVVCFMSDDIVTAISTIGKLLAKDPIGLCRSIVNIVKGTNIVK